MKVSCTNLKIHTVGNWGYIIRHNDEGREKKIIISKYGIPGHPEEGYIMPKKLYYPCLFRLSRLVEQR